MNQVIPFGEKEKYEIVKILAYWDVDDGTIKIQDDYVSHPWPLPTKRHQLALDAIKSYLTTKITPNAASQPNIAEEACKLVIGDRNESYGDPKDDYMGTAKVWSGLLIGKLKPGVEISAKEAILMMAALKLRREVTRPKRDNLVDAIGYSLCANWVETGQKPKPLAS